MQQDRSVTHATFRIERVYKASPARVFAAWASAEAKRRWYACDETWKLSEFTLDFRVGGRERLVTGPEGGAPHTFEGVYHDIVDGARIVYSYGMYVGEARISVSLTTIEITSEGSGAKLVFTEQGAFLDGHQTAEEREEGTRIGLDGLGAFLDVEEA